MANTITLAEIKTQARERADMENSSFISDTELLSYVNLSYAELYDLLVSRFEDYYTMDTTLVVASGASSVSLPADFYKLRGVDRSISSNDWVAIPKFNFNNRNNRNTNVSRLMSGQFNVAYRIVGNSLHLTPTDTAAGSYRLWYVPTYTKLVDSTDTVDGVNGWEEYIIVDVAIKMLAKEDSSVSHLMQQKQALIDRIESMAQNRDIDQPETISDVSALSFDPDIY